MNDEARDAASNQPLSINSEATPDAAIFSRANPAPGTGVFPTAGVVLWRRGGGGICFNWTTKMRIFKKSIISTEIDTITRIQPYFYLIEKLQDHLSLIILLILNLLDSARYITIQYRQHWPLNMILELQCFQYIYPLLRFHKDLTCLIFLCFLLYLIQEAIIIVSYGCWFFLSIQLVLSNSSPYLIVGQRQQSISKNSCKFSVYLFIIIL